MKNVKGISFPNTVADNDKCFYEVGKNGIEEIRETFKNGEMAAVKWFEIVKDNKIIAEIKESVCDVYGEDELPDKVNVPF